jgi:hypothetical protein
MRVTKLFDNRSVQESRTTGGDSPVGEIEQSLEGYLSKSGHVESRLNLRRPFRKAKYGLMTDSELSMVTER